MLVTFALGAIVYVVWHVRDITSNGSPLRAANTWHKLPACGFLNTSRKLMPLFPERPLGGDHCETLNIESGYGYVATTTD